ncbi:MAG: outer membrane protein assembly factor BamB family protein, partial [Planctomycetota bacterium]
MRELRRKSAAAAGLFLLAVAASAEDWPTHRHDNKRSGIAAEGLESLKLKIKWTWRSPSAPQPAWAGPAKWDAYARIPKLGAMRDYDRAFGVALAGGKVYFGSSADDSVHCLEAGTGKERWAYTTGGPVRISPTVVEGKVYFGSDDGHAYCVTADTGSLVWKYSPKPDVTRLLHNGKLISPYPCRTGVLVEGNTAYFAAGMLPWKPAYVCAVDAATGEAGGSGRYVSEQRLTPEGAVLAAAGRLIFPQGRVAPVAVDRASGRALGRVGKGQGGTFALVTKDSHVFYGQGCKDSGISSQSQGVAFAKARRLVVAGDTAFVATDTELFAHA